MGFVGIVFDLGACVATELNDDGFLVAQPDGAGEDPRVNSYEVQHTFGFASRPQDPELDADGHIVEGQVCNLLIGSTGNENYSWLGSDPRATALMPPLAKGSSVQYALRKDKKRSFTVIDGETGTVTTYIEAGATAHVITVGVDGNGKELIGFAHARGLSFSMLEKTITLKNAAGDVYLEMNDSGHILNGNAKVVGTLEVNGATIDPTGDVITAEGVSLRMHMTPSPFGPLGPPIPTPS